MLADDSLTMREEHEKVRALLKAAPPAALQELRAAHVHAPGLHRGGRRGHHGRPHSTTAVAPAAQ